MQARAVDNLVDYVDEAGPAARHIQRGRPVLAINDDERYAVLGLFEGVSWTAAQRTA